MMEDSCTSLEHKKLKKLGLVVQMWIPSAREAEPGG